MAGGAKCWREIKLDERAGKREGSRCRWWGRGVYAKGKAEQRPEASGYRRQQFKVGDQPESLCWRLEGRGSRGSCQSQYGDCKENMPVTTAQGSPGSSIRQTQVAISIFGLETQPWLCFVFWPSSHEVFNNGKCKAAAVTPTLPEGQTPIRCPGGRRVWPRLLGSGRVLASKTALGNQRRQVPAPRTPKSLTDE